MKIRLKNYCPELDSTAADRLYFDCEWQNKVFTLIDTGGLEIGKTDFIAENIRKQAEVAIEESDVIVFAVDAITGITNDDLELANILRKSDKPIIVAVNKIDFKKAKDNVMDFYLKAVNQRVRPKPIVQEEPAEVAEPVVTNEVQTEAPSEQAGNSEE